MCLQLLVIVHSIEYRSIYRQHQRHSNALPTGKGLYPKLLLEAIWGKNVATWSYILGHFILSFSCFVVVILRFSD